MKKYRLHIIIVLSTVVLFNIATLFLPPNFRRLSLYTLLFVFDTVVLIPFFRIFNSWNKSKKRAFLTIYWAPFTLLTLVVTVAIFIPLPDWVSEVKISVATLLFTLYITHLLIWIFLLLSYLIRWLSRSRTAANIVLFFGLSVTAVLFAVCLAAPFLWTVNPQVTQVKIVSEEVPKSFSGYKIVQISDLHCDYFRNEKPFQAMADSITRLNPNMIVITGDIVTFKSAEIKRFLDVFRQIKAIDGVYVIMGNHDYGAYYNRWKSEDEVLQNQKELFDCYNQLHWRLLRNEAVYIEKNSDTLVIAGTENQSLKKTYYPSKGDFHLALQNIPKHLPVILMTHDPIYWEKEISQNKRPIMLTLSGHTHGLQIGYHTPSSQWNIFGLFKKYSGGLYEKNGRYLYVNTGFGTVGFPFRIGLRPEITVLTLDCEIDPQ